MGNIVDFLTPRDLMNFFISFILFAVGLGGEYRDTYFRNLGPSVNMATLMNTMDDYLGLDDPKIDSSMLKENDAMALINSQLANVERYRNDGAHANHKL